MKTKELGTLLLLWAAAAMSQTPQIPRTADGKPDFSGYWTLPYFPNMAQNKEAEVPYTPQGLAAFKNHDSKDDPTSLSWRAAHHVFAVPLASDSNTRLRRHVIRIYAIVARDSDGSSAPPGESGTHLHGRFHRLVGG